MKNQPVNIAIVGGGPGCKAVLKLFERAEMTALRVNVIGVADVDEEAPGFRYAKERGIVAVKDFSGLLSLPDLDLVIELTGDDLVLQNILKFKPARVKVMDHVAARLFWDVIQIDETKARIQEEYLEEKKQSDATKRYKILVENLNDMVFSLDLNGIITYTNPAVKDILGYDPEEFVGRSFYELLSPEDSAPIKSILTNAEGGYCFECGFRDKSGNSRIMKLSGHRITSDGRKTGFSGIGRDITERVKAEQNLIRSNQIFKAIHDLSLDNTRNSMDFLNALCATVYRLLGGSFVTISHYDKNGFVLKASYNVPDKLTHMCREGVHNTLCRKILETRRAVYFSNVGGDCLQQDCKMAKEGDVKAYLGVPLRSSDGGILGVLGFFDREEHSFNDEDIRLFEILAQRASIELEKEIEEHEKELLQEQLFQAQKMEAIGTLAGGIAHDFNNLLSGILGYASYGKILLPEDHPVHKHLEVIEKSAERSAELVRQMLGFSRGGKYEVRKVNCNLIIEEAVKLLSRTIDKSIEIETRLSSHLTLVLADIVQMQQVVLNICINARDAMPNGGRLILETQNVVLDEIYARKHLGSAPGNYVLIAISDTGVGMDPNVKRRIFEPFFTTKEKGKGTGLGLAMVYGIVKNHSGYVTFYSEKGMGTRFSIYLPAIKEGEADITATKQEEVLKGKETILLIDDEEVIRELGKEVLEQLGYKVLLAEDGVEAMKIYKKNADQIDLVILDIVMPKAGGKTTFSELRGKNPALKIIVSSGYSIDGDAQDLMRSGAHAFIQKPYRVDELSSVIRRVLDE